MSQFIESARFFASLLSNLFTILKCKYERNAKNAKLGELHMKYVNTQTLNVI